MAKLAVPGHVATILNDQKSAAEAEKQMAMAAIQTHRAIAIQIYSQLVPLEYQNARAVQAHEVDPMGVGASSEEPAPPPPLQISFVAPAEVAVLAASALMRKLGYPMVPHQDTVPSSQDANQ